jgi:phage tail sheath protein FI
MPITPTYPGVYIEEIPSGARTIASIATSICAFVGPTKQGPVNEPNTVFSFGEFDRRFGGLSLASPLSFSVRDFFLNGGGQAIIVRVVHDGLDANGEEDGDKVAASAASWTIEDSESELAGFTLEAANPGTWANDIIVWVVVPGEPSSTPTEFDTGHGNEQSAAAEVAAAQGVPTEALFHVRILDASTTKIDASGESERILVPAVLESFDNVTLVDGPRRLDKVLANGSKLVRVTGPLGDAEAPTKGDYVVRVTVEGVDGSVPEAHHLSTDTVTKQGVQALEKADLFNLLVIPPTQLGASGDISSSVWEAAAAYCLEKRAILLLDPPDSSNFNYDAAQKPTEGGSPVVGITGDVAKNTSFYFPRVMEKNPLRDGQLEEFAPCGAIAGVIARTDTNRGVWKAPAGIDAALTGVPSLAIRLTDGENGVLNQLGVNCMRTFSTAGRVVWGSRTRKGADALSSEWKYLPVRRTALYIEESLFRGLQWVVFEPNDEPLWAQIRLNVGSFMNRLFKQGAFQGSKPAEAFLVKCDRETTTQDDIDRGVVNVVVGFAPLKPAEFVILKLQQLAGQSAA